MSESESTNIKENVFDLESSNFDIDLIEVDDLLNSAQQLLEEVYSLRPPPTINQEPISPRDDAIEQVQRFLCSIREPEEEDDVVFVEARPGNALPASARTTAVVDLCTPTTGDEDNNCNTNTRPSRRRRRTNDIAPVSFPDLEQEPRGSKTTTRRRRGAKSLTKPKPEPRDNDDPDVVSVDSPATHGKKSGAYGEMPPLTCAVCMESVITRQPTSTACGHIFCQTCITQAIRLTKKCPLCNYKLKLNQVHRVYF